MKSIIERYRYSFILLNQLVKTDFKLRYQGSALGYVWSLLKPLALFLILYIVFAKFLRIGEEIPNFAIYLLLGIVLWSFFGEVTNNSVGLIVGKGDLLRKIKFPVYAILLAGSFSAVINLCFNLVVVFGFMAFKGINPGFDALLFPLLVLELYLFSLACAFFLSTAYVKYRDFNYIWEVVMQGLFYAIPILYPLSIVADKYNLLAKLMVLNPLTQIIQDSRFVLISSKTLIIDDLFATGFARLIPIFITIVFLVLSALYFRSRSKYFAEEV